MTEPTTQEDYAERDRRERLRQAIQDALENLPSGPEGDPLGRRDQAADWLAEIEQTLVDETEPSALTQLQRRVGAVKNPDLRDALRVVTRHILRPDEPAVDRNEASWSVDEDIEDGTGIAISLYQF